MKPTLFLFLLFLCPSTFLAQVPFHTDCYIADPGAVPREQLVDMIHMRLEVSFEPEKGLVRGQVTHFFSPLRKRVDSLFLDGPGIRISEARLNGKPITFRSTPEGFYFFPQPALTWGTTDSLFIRYEAEPRSGLYFIGWNDPRNLSRKQIWTQGQGTDNRYWFPAYDSQNDKLTTETIIHFDSGYQVLSNGKLLAKTDDPNGETRWHYRMTHPHTTYLVMIGIGKYAIKASKSKSGVPMYAWYYPELEDRVEAVYRYSEEMMDFFENETGVPYPWEQYSQIPVQDFMYGAMENTTATLFGDFYLIDERSYLDKNYVGTNAHELAHQWFGDYVTARSGAHHWLQESFATYYSLLFDEVAFGKDYFDWGRRNAALRALAEAEKNALPVAHSRAGTARWYPKGALVLHMLRDVLGEDQYRKGITHYLKKHGYGIVDSEDLLVAFYEALGYPLDWFWEQWVYRGGEPHYQVTFSDLTEADKRYSEFRVEQIQEISDVLPLFDMPVSFYVRYLDGSSDSVRVRVNRRSQQIRIPNPGKRDIDFVLFDPGHQILKQISFQKPERMLRAQAVKATSVLDRHEAVQGLEKYGLEANEKLYTSILKSNEFFGVKEAVIEQAAKGQGKVALSLLKLALQDSDPNVRKAVARSVSRIPDELVKDFEKLLEDSSYETIEIVLDKLTFQFPDKVNQYVKKTEGVTGTRGNNVLVKSLEVKGRTSHEAVKELVRMTSNSYEFITRTKAMEALVRLNHFDMDLLENLLNAAFTPNRRLAGPATDALKFFAGQTRYRKMIEDYTNAVNYSPWQNEIIRGVLN